VTVGPRYPAGMTSEPRRPAVLPYADASVPAGLDDVQVFRIGDDLRRVAVPHGVSFEVTPFAFRLAVAGPFGTRRSAWPRSALLEVRVNRLANRLVLRLAGQDPLELNVGPNPTTTERVMHEMIASMTVIPVAPADQQVVAGDPAGGLSPSPARSLLLYASVGLMALGIVCLSIPPHVLGCYAFLAAAVPAGIAFGTQRKEIWP
jgi:hypothetical protein